MYMWMLIATILFSRKNVGRGNKSGILVGENISQYKQD